jgi:hypothetical protein
MKNKKLNPKRRKPFFNRSSINSRINSIQNKEVNEILSIYFICEDTAIKIIEAAYLPEFISKKFEVKQLKYAMQNLGYSVNNSIDLIFNTNFNNNGLYSVRHLRNKIIHLASKSAIKEVIRNRKRYLDSMMEFIDLCCE